MSGIVPYLTHTLDELSRLLGGGQPAQSPNTGASGTPSSSASTPVTAGSVQHQAHSSSSAAPSATASSPSGGVGGEPVTQQATPMTVTLSKPVSLYGTPLSSANSTAKNTAHIVSVPASEDHSAPLIQSDQGWMIFGAAWYWWTILVLAVVIAGILVNRAFETRKKEPSIFKRILRL